MTITTSLVTAALAATAFGGSAANAVPASPVIEVVTLKIKPDVTVDQFSKVDQAVKDQYIAKRQGYISRESAPGSNHDWLVIVHWRSLDDAEASMKTFESAPAAAKFMAMIVPNSMVMTRYSRTGL